MISTLIVEEKCLTEEVNTQENALLDESKIGKKMGKSKVNNKVVKVCCYYCGKPNHITCNF
jgi:hypothetical protein